MRTLIDRIAIGPVLGDGTLGTMIYARGADVVGTNCGAGPAVLLGIVEEMIVGGCCGTTLDMIREMGRFRKSVAASARSASFVHHRPSKTLRTPVSLAAHGSKKLASVELSPPLGTDYTKLVRGARLLKDGGVDVVLDVLKSM